MIKPKLIKWARERAGTTLEKAKKISKKYEDWEQGKISPTLKQVKIISQKLHVPFGYLFLDEPPEEKLPIPDFRTVDNEELKEPSLALLEIIYDAKRKQNWLREQKIKDNEDRILKKENYTDGEIIEKINSLLDIENLRKKSSTYEDFLNYLIKKLDEKEFLIIRNGMVGNNTSRSLDVEEFKGFVLFDEYAPTIFINGQDYKSSQIFTLIHELVHLFLNESALDGNYRLGTEQKCNKIAAEILLPKEQFEERLGVNKEAEIAKFFKVSIFVVLIKSLQGGFVSKGGFEKKWEKYNETVKKNKLKAEGVNFYNTVKYKAGGEGFLFRVCNSTMAGETLYKEAYSLTGLKEKTFNKFYLENLLK